MTMNSHDIIRSISSLKELELLRKQIKAEIRYTELIVKSDFNAIFSGSWSLINETTIRKGLFLSLSFLAKHLTRKVALKRAGS